MVALGPRVGGAHVDVNMKFDDKSLDRIGKKIHDQLTRVGNHNREVYRSLGRESVTAWRAALGAVVASAPLMGSLISGVAASATMLAGALYSTVQSTYGLLPLLSSVGIAAATARIGMQGFIDSLKSPDDASFYASLENLSHSAGSAAIAVRGLRDESEILRVAVQERMFKGLADDITRLGSTLFPVLQTGFVKMAGSLNGLAKSLLDYANSSAGLQQISALMDNSADIFARLSNAVVPFLDGFLRLTNALAPAGKRLADRIAEVAENFQHWTSAETFGLQIDDMMKKAEKTAGLLIDVVVNLGNALHNVFAGANPATNTFLQMLVDLTQRFEDWSGSLAGQESIGRWAADGVEVMRQFGRTMKAVFTVVSELADPRVIISFLTTVEGAFNILAQLPLAKITDAFVRVAEVMQPISSLFLAVIIGAAAFNILLGSLIGQLGGFFSVLAGMVKFKILTNILKNVGGGAHKAGTAAQGAATKTGLLSRAWGFLVGILSRVSSVFGKVTGAFSKTSATTGKVATKATKLSGAFKPVMSILGRFARFAGPVGLAVWIGSIIAQSDKLKKKLGDVWDAMKGTWDSLVGAFEEISTALKPMAPVAEAAGKAFSFVFGLFDKIGEIAIGLVLDTIIYGFKSLSNVLKGAGKIIAGVINVLVGLFTWDPGKMMDGLKQIGDGIGPLLKGLFGLFVTFFAPAKFLKLAGIAFKALGGGIKRAAPPVLSAIGRFIGRALKWFLTLGPRLLRIGGNAIVSLGKAMAARMPKAVGRVSGILGDWFGKVGTLFKNGWNRAVNTLKSAWSRMTGSVSKGVDDAVEEVSGLPGRVLRGLGNIGSFLYNSGKALLDGFLNGITAGFDKVSGAVSSGLSKIRNLFPFSPAKTGPFSGRGYTSHSGRALAEDFGKGMQGAFPRVAGSLRDFFTTLSRDSNAGARAAADGALGQLGRLSETVLGQPRAGALARGLLDGLNGAESELSRILTRVSTLFAQQIRAAIAAAARAMGPRPSVVVSEAYGVAPFQSRRPGPGPAGSPGGRPRPRTSRVVLRIGSRDFEAYVEELADGRIEAADALAWQGA